MQAVLQLIQQKQQEFAQLPLFKFLDDSNVDPKQKLTFAPYFAFFVMSYAEMNKHILRVEPTNDEIQALINNHTYEEESHWTWFIEDLKQLEFDNLLCFSDAIQFLWGEGTKTQRQVIYKLFRLAFQASPLEKLVLTEAIEATADIFLEATRSAANELREITHKKYRYFGEIHVIADASHAMYSQEVHTFIANIQLTEAEQRNLFKLVEQVYDIFTELMDDLLLRAQLQKFKQIEHGEKGKNMETERHVELAGSQTRFVTT